MALSSSADEKVSRFVLFVKGLKVLTKTISETVPMPCGLRIICQWFFTKVRREFALFQSSWVDSDRKDTSCTDDQDNFPNDENIKLL